MDQDSNDFEYLLRRAAAGDQPALAALWARHFEGLTDGESAQVRGLSQTAANNRDFRTLGRVRDLLGRVSGFFDEGSGRPGWSIFGGFRGRGRDAGTR